MKKKGFTLIELLAVIVILAIIALIATPLVLKYIEYSKEKSAKLSANTYAEAVEKEYVSKLTHNEKMPNKEYTIKELDELGVKVKGDKPEGDSDTVTLQNGNVIKYKLTIKGYIITYEDGKTTVEAEKDSTSSNDGLLDYTVKFIVDGEMYQIISVKNGQTINAPNEVPTVDEGLFSCWKDINGNVISFPYPPTSSIELFAQFSSNAEMLYNFHGVDQSGYPHIIMTRDGTSSPYVFYAESFYYSSGKLYLVNSVRYSTSGVDSTIDSSDIEKIVSTIVKGYKDTGTTMTSPLGLPRYSSYTYYSNADIGEFGTYIPL